MLDYASAIPYAIMSYKTKVNVTMMTRYVRLGGMVLKRKRR